MRVNEVIGYRITRDEYDKYNISDTYTHKNFVGTIINKRYDNSFGGVNKGIFHILINSVIYDKLIEFEGIDASGKTTYISMLENYLKSINQKVKVYSFPDYNSRIGKIIKRYLNNEIQIDREVISALYSVDRVGIQEDLQYYLDNDYYVLLNRYTYSNLFQITKLQDKEQGIKDLEKFEYKELRIKQAGKVIYLTASLDEILRRINNRKKIDKYEKDIDLLKQTNDLYLQTAKEKNWSIINEDNLTKQEVLELIKKEIGV